MGKSIAQGDSPGSLNYNAKYQQSTSLKFQEEPLNSPDFFRLEKDFRKELAQQLGFIIKEPEVQ